VFFFKLIVRCSCVFGLEVRLLGAWCSTVQVLGFWFGDAGTVQYLVSSIGAAVRIVLCGNENFFKPVPYQVPVLYEFVRLAVCLESTH